MESIKMDFQHSPAFCQEDLLLYDFNDADDHAFEAHLVARQLKGGGIFICLQGETEFSVDLKSYKLKKGDMCVVFPFSILQTINKSDDFERYAIGVSLELVSDIQIPSSTEYYLYIKDNPCISLDEKEVKMLLELFGLMMQKYASTDHPFRQEIARSLFKVIYCEMAAIYTKRNPIIQESVPRKDLLVRKFMFDVAKNYHKHRNVDYYAGELCVTPRYLSSVIKEKTGSSASLWINSMVIKQAKILLKENKLSVLQIADKLNFANPSFFGQYFKKQTGITPKRYRDKVI